MRLFLLSMALCCSAISARADFSNFTENVLMHVIAHEMGHAVIREFDLPILGNEETMADDFATILLAQHFPERIAEIVKARADSFLYENDKESIFSEHPDDAKRAGRAVCILYGINPERHEALAKSYSMTAREASNCRDFAPEVARSWRRALAKLEMPETARVTEVRFIVGEGPMERDFRRSNAMKEMTGVLSSVDWHSLITLHADHCDRGASWDRGRRTILICDTYAQRFEDQDRALN